MKLFALLFAVVVTAESLTVKDHWEKFKTDFDKKYQNIAEETRRFRIFQDKFQEIEEHNARYTAGLETYYKGITRFSDLTKEETQGFFKKIHDDTTNWVPKTFETPANVPDQVDWREKAAVFPASDEGNCGASYAFSVTGALEGQNYLVNNISVKLSDQQLVDCDHNNANCQGGNQSNSYNYIMQAGGLNSFDDYPFRKHPGDCRVVSKKYAAMKYTATVGATEEQLRNALAEIGPISVSIYGDWVLDYAGGIYTGSCVNLVQYLDLSALLVGYGVENGTKYWLLRGSFGRKWGEKGYFRLLKDANMCGVALRASYPVLEPVKKTR
ncbi:unnamed protein product [Phyllotreta striolata]|uniref:Uncharacterized protein n=1 Tax=Phyllotreta striolata TaxID=444603 RepID=A0A9N9TW76_PHYSR|nr:unnamed protein product [Phyllotreta striolata]